MSITVIGNRGPAFKSNAPKGVGVSGVQQGIGWCSVCASSAGETYVQLSSIISSDIALGVFIQGSGATCEFTLANPAMATNPDPRVQASVMWSGSMPASDDIQRVPTLFTVMKVKFTGPGELYIIAR